jgi:hypothetical protein
MKAYGGVDVQIHIFLTSALSAGEWSVSRPCRFTPGERAHRTHWIGGSVGPRAGQDNLEKRKFLSLPGLELRSLGRPARSQSLYRLRYPGSIVLGTRWKWAVSFTPLPLYPRWTSHLFGRRLGGPKIRYERCGKEKNIALPGIEPRPSSP